MPDPIRSLVGQSALPAGGRVYGDLLRLEVQLQRTVVLLRLAQDSQKSLGRLRIADRPVPQTMNTWLGEDPVYCRVGPDSWLLISVGHHGAELADAARSACAKRAGAVTDLSDAHAGIVVEGPRALDILVRGCALDFAAFGDDACARTRFAQLPVMLRRTSPDRFELLVDRAVAKHLFDWLQDAAAGLDGQPS
ncbi:MAG: sarcosine oxidase subunit gamma family protein [Steroidobacteraceae bacterium]